MPGRRAKTLAPTALRALLKHAARETDPVRSRVMILLSVRAGLRASEIAKLEWSMVLDPHGAIGKTIEVIDAISKKGSGRTVPLHPELAHALGRLLNSTSPIGPIVRSTRGGAMKPNSIVNWFVQLYRAVGLEGCSSHSGRRTFITHAARLVHKAGGSLRDVQLLAGHRSIETTQGYIDGDTQAQRRLVFLL